MALHEVYKKFSCKSRCYTTTDSESGIKLFLIKCYNNCTNFYNIIKSEFMIIIIY